MADYIRREDAIKYAEHAYHEWNLAMAAADGKREINLVYKRQELCKAVESVFRDMPAADVAPVLRCKDCQHFKHYGKTSLFADGKNIKAGWCNRRVRYDEEYRMPPDGFCSYGRRMDGGNENG